MRCPLRLRAELSVHPLEIGRVTRPLAKVWLLAKPLSLPSVGKRLAIILRIGVLPLNREVGDGDGASVRVMWGLSMIV